MTGSVATINVQSKPTAMMWLQSEPGDEAVIGGEGEEVIGGEGDDLIGSES